MSIDAFQIFHYRIIHYIGAKEREREGGRGKDVSHSGVSVYLFSQYLPQYNGLIIASTPHMKVSLVDVLKYMHWKLVSAIGGLVFC